jgi:flavin-dependent dehydrogenase
VTNGDTSRYEEAWNEAVEYENRKRWRRIRRVGRWLRQQLSSAGKVRSQEEDVVRISPEAVMTKDGHILYIDPRCERCREYFR